MDIKPTCFSLFKNNDNIEDGLTEDFINIFKKCKYPHIVCIYGDSKTGRSTKMNQIINGIKVNNYFDLKEPFKTLKEIHTTMTKGINFYGPIKIVDIANKNDIDINEIDKQIINDELFFVDTEGLRTIDYKTKAFISGILTILQISSIKILYIPFLDNEKLEDSLKSIKLSNILNLFNNQSQNIVLIRDLPLKENKEEKRIIAELYHQKFFLDNKINYLLNNLDGNINAKCEILPSFELASNNIELFPDCYKQKMEDLVYTILTNIKYDRTLTGNKLIEIIYELLEIFKNVNNIEILKNDENKLDLILLELFKEKVKKIYLDINDKIDKFDKYIISLNGKPESIKNFLIENIKNEIKNTWEIYDKKIHNEIIQQLEIITYQIEVNIKSALEKEKDKMTNDIFSIIDINNNKEIMNYLSQITYKEEINQNKIKELLDNIINNFSNKYKLYFEYTDVIDKNYKTKTIEYIKSILNKNINYIIESKPN